MDKPIVAQLSTAIDAPIAKVWDALINPATIKEYMFGTNVTSEWKEGSQITWKGEWQGKSYEDKGVILRLEPQRLIQYSHFSPLSGLPDTPANYHRDDHAIARASPNPCFAEPGQQPHRAVARAR